MSSRVLYMIGIPSVPVNGKKKKEKLKILFLDVVFDS